LVDAAAIAADGGGGVLPLTLFASAFFAFDDFDLSGLILAAKNAGGGRL
jgi:hypothetical protein